jgi:hypothetical protein
VGVIADSWEAESRERVWRDFCTMPGPRAAKAMRVLLGLTPHRAALLARVPFDLVAAFETNTIDLLHWHWVSRRLNAAYRALGATWCEPDLHEGAHCVYLLAGFADDRRAILAAIALMGHTAGKRSRKVTSGRLVERVAKRTRIQADQLRRALSGRERLTQCMAAQCFMQLGDGRGGAGCYFVPAPLGGWRGVGCDYAGCWW